MASKTRFGSREYAGQTNLPEVIIINGYRYVRQTEMGDITTPNIIIEASIKTFRTTKDAFESESRVSNVSKCRQAAAILMRKYCDITLKEVGDRMGGRDHATVINQINRGRYNLEMSPTFTEKFYAIEEEISKPSTTFTN